MGEFWNRKKSGRAVFPGKKEEVAPGIQVVERTARTVSMCCCGDSVPSVFLSYSQCARDSKSPRGKLICLAFESELSHIQALTREDLDQWLPQDLRQLARLNSLKHVVCYVKNSGKWIVIIHFVETIAKSNELELRNWGSNFSSSIM